MLVIAKTAHAIVVGILETILTDWTVPVTYGETFINTLKRVEAAENVVMTHIRNDDAIFDALKCFLGKGR